MCASICVYQSVFIYEHMLRRPGNLGGWVKGNLIEKNATQKDQYKRDNDCPLCCLA